MKKMKAAMFYAPGDVRIEEVELPRVGDKEILVRVKIALTCGTDVKSYRRGYSLFKPPCLFGHEWAGDVVEVGENVSGFKEGMRVVGHNTAPCGRCYYCKKGYHSMCEYLMDNLLLGAYAEYIKVPSAIVEQNLFEIPDVISYKAAALLEPLSCVVYGTDEIGIQLGDSVVINGAGPIGLMFVRLAKLKGARVISCDLSEQRLAVARKIGADETINVSHTKDQVASVQELTEDKRGVDVAIEATGFPKVWEMTILMARKAGKVLLFGGCKAGTTITVGTELLHYSQLTLKGVFHTTPRHVKTAYDLITRRMMPEDLLVTDEVPLSETVKALEMHLHQAGIKIAIVP